MTAMRRNIGHWIRVVAIGFVALPVPSRTRCGLPVPLPSAPAPTVAAAPVPLPALTPPGVQPTSLVPPSQGSQSGTAADHPAGTPVTAAAPAGNPPHGITIPFTTILVSSPLDIALIGTLVTLPLLFGIWMLLFGRTFRAARRVREAQVRVVVAAGPRVWAEGPLSMDTKTLSHPREKI